MQIGTIMWMRIAGMITLHQENIAGMLDTGEEETVHLTHNIPSTIAELTMIDPVDLLLDVGRVKLSSRGVLVPLLAKRMS